MIRACVTSLVVAAVLGGCGGEIYRESTGLLPDSVTPRREWRLGGEVAEAALAVDRRLDTAATVAGDYVGRGLNIDLGRPCVFNLAVVDHGTAPGGYAGQVMLMTSTDGRNWVPQHEVPGTPRVTTFSLIRPIMARYVRIVPTKPAGDTWRVAEVYLQ